MSKIVIVVPCFNEAQRLDLTCFRQFAGAARPVKFLMVNDGSTDGTLEMLERLRFGNRTSFELHDLPQNSGKAEAVRQGMLKAWDSEAEYIGYWDADLATPLEQIADFCRLLDQKPHIDAVFGSRIAMPGRTIVRRKTRRLLGRLFNSIISAALGMQVHDTQCGAKLFRATDEMKAVFAQPFTVGWIFDVEILARLIAARRGTPLPPVRDLVYEQPLDYWVEVPGSKLRAQDFLKAIGETAGIYWRYLRPGLSRGQVIRPQVEESAEVHDSPRRAA